jgi:chemotaxis protein MotB
MRAAIFLACTALALGCGVPKEEHQKVLDSMKQLQGDYGKLQKRNEKSEEQLSVYKGQLEALGQDLSKAKEGSEMTSAELELARRRMVELHRQQEANEVRISRFRKIAKQMMADGKIEVQVRKGRMVVRLPDDILFPPGKADLKPEGKDAIAQVGSVLRDIEGRRFQVAGHTDNIPLGKRGKFKSNWDLSLARSLVVLNILKDSGVNVNALSAAGFADTDPVADNGSDDGRRKNRRIEIVLEPDVTELPGMDEILKTTPTNRTVPAPSG